MFVEFYDNTEEKILAIFAGPQDLEYHPYMGEVDEDDLRYAAYLNPPGKIIVINSVKLRELVQLATSQKEDLSNRIADLEFSIEDGTAAPGEDAELVTRKAQLVLWFRYSSSLGRVTSQAGWPMTVDWPTEPAVGMDLTVSASVSEAG